MTCAWCTERGKTWEGDEPRCAFDASTPFKPFDPENWNCATMNALRDAIGASFVSDGDQHHATIAIERDGWPDSTNGAPLALWLTWYKNRGCTEGAWLLFEDLPPRPPTEADIRHITCVLIGAAATAESRRRRQS